MQYAILIIAIILAAAVGLVIFYFITKSAVSEGIMSAYKYIQNDIQAKNDAPIGGESTHETTIDELLQHHPTDMH